MIGPFGRQGLAATLRQHCPQMTQRRCNSMEDTFLHFPESHISQDVIFTRKTHFSGKSNFPGKLRGTPGATKNRYYSIPRNYFGNFRSQCGNENKVIALIKALRIEKSSVVFIFPRQSS